MALRPRFALSLLLFIAAVLAINALFNPTKTFTDARLFLSRPGLRAVLEAEEADYLLAMEDREDLVRKWGPTARDVNPFPMNGPLYTLWDFFVPAFRCPHRVRRVGTLGDGGKWFCGLERYARQRAPCVIYSFGINNESSFEAALLTAAPRCEVWGYDFSVKSFGPEIEEQPGLSARTHFFPFALGSEDMPHNDPPTFTLQELMRQNNHTFIDVLKVDIEGAEFESLSTFIEHFVPQDASMDAVLPIGQLQLEIHARNRNAIFWKFKQWWENLERAGLRPFWTEPNLVYVNVVRGTPPDLAEYSFMNIRGRHILTDDYY